MKPNYTPQHLVLFTGIDVQCQGASTWILHNKKEVLTPLFMKTLMEDGAIDWVKPLLRPLGSMTDDECIHISKLALDIQDSHITDMTTFSVVPFEGDEVKIKAHYYDTLLETYVDATVNISDDFYITHSCYNLAPHNQPQIFQYLIQQQFDVFGWIPSEIALDKTKM